MKTQSKSLIAIATATFVGVSALAVARGADRITPDGFVPTFQSRSVVVGGICPPNACSVVFKTATGGPPSKVFHVD